MKRKKRTNHKTITECLIEILDEKPEGSDKTYRELIEEQARKHGWSKHVKRK